MKTIIISTKENAVFVFEDFFTNSFSIWADEIELKTYGKGVKGSFSISAYINSNYIGGFSNRFEECEIIVESENNRQKVQTIEELKNLVK